MTVTLFIAGLIIVAAILSSQNASADTGQVMDYSTDNTDTSGNLSDAGTVADSSASDITQPAEQAATGPNELPDMPTVTFEAIALAIQTFEGWGTGTRSFRNNNPGNLKYASWESSYGVTGKDAQGFAVFPSYDQGFRALIALLKSKARNNPNWTLLNLMNNYAPSSDNNNPTQYADFIAQQTGASSDTLLSDIAS